MSNGLLDLWTWAIVYRGEARGDLTVTLVLVLIFLSCLVSFAFLEVVLHLPPMLSPWGAVCAP